ncbi:MAG: tetratricopeptide repeat protein, partial [Pyrinomonadaceae bacterium]
MTKTPIAEAAAKTKSTKHRIAVIAAIVGLCFFGWFGVRTQIGNMLGELTSPSREDAGDVADVAIRFAPNDPQPRWLAAMVYKKSFESEDVERSVASLEAAVRRTPNDYRMWTELARGYEQSERYSEAEAALRRSIKLAPNYAIPHWQLGNFLLRQDRIDEAKAELKLTTQTSSAFRDQVYSLAWDFFGKDTSQVEELAADTADARANLALFYTQRDRGGDALRIWNTLSPEQKQYYNVIAHKMAWYLYGIGSVRESLIIARDVGIANGVADETVNNGG